MQISPQPFDIKKRNISFWEWYVMDSVSYFTLCKRFPTPSMNKLHFCDNVLSKFNAVYYIRLFLRKFRENPTTASKVKHGFSPNSISIIGQFIKLLTGGAAVTLQAQKL